MTPTPAEPRPRTPDAAGGRSPQPAGADESDEALLARFVNGDEQAYASLVRRYERRVFAICYRYFDDAADAEDAAQDAFLSLYRRAATFAGAAKFSTWMYRVATNACNDVARRRSRRPQRTGADVGDLAERLPAAEDLIGQRELALELRAALDELPSDYRQAVLLHTVLGWPYHDIAEQVGVAVGTVKSRVHRGHARLALTLRHLGTEAAPDATGRERSPRAPPPT